MQRMASYDRAMRLLFCFALLGGLLAACVSAATVPPSTPSPPPFSSSDPLPTPRPRRLQAGELELAADIDAIPAIFASPDLFVDARAGSEEWPDEEPVIGVELGTEARAYPIRLLSLHEIVNDTIGGEPVAVTWCPLCYSALVFGRTVAGRELTFGVSGYLYRNNLVMYDHQTNTLWSQVLAQGLKGARRGDRLRVYPSLITGWGAWKRTHPHTRILSAERMGRRADEIIDPYAGYYTAGSAGLLGSDRQDTRLAAKALVVGVRAGDKARAYLVDSVREAGILQDRIGALSLILVYDRKLQTVLTYRSNIGQRRLTFVAPAGEDTMRDIETGSLWDIRSGRALQGPLAGQTLHRLAAPLVFWFAWSDLYPHTELFAPPE
ncbi:MAG: DUF3179 domain-containing protein [Caldilineae bacterium]|nr:MAG: DUF3179 domain-containing protein [Caldilineae bacterium]